MSTFCLGECQNLNFKSEGQGKKNKSIQTAKGGYLQRNKTQGDLGLPLGRKVMTNLDSIFKSRDITLPTKVRLVKAMVLPVVMYGCESWTVKKA